MWWFKGRYGRTKKKIEDYINLTAESINQEIGYPVLARVRVEIVNAKDIPAELGENDVIVRLRPKGSPYNTAYVLRDALEEGLLRDARRFVPEKLFRASQYVLGKEVILEHYRVDEGTKMETIRQFGRLMEEELKDERISKNIEIIEDLSSKRLFKTVLLRELYLLGESLLGKPSRPGIQDEIKNFVAFLKNIAVKKQYEEEHGKKPPLAFKGERIRVGIVLVMREDADDTIGHVNAVFYNFEKSGVKSAYLMARGKHMEAARNAHKEVMAKRDKSSVKFDHVATVNFRLPRRHGKIISTEGICFIYQRQSGIRG
ncbi:MAG: hypothetical protein ACPL68_07530 [Candidatus Hydrothermia bacterium]